MSDRQVKTGILARRRSRLIGFLVSELLAIGLLILAGTVALWPQWLTNSTLAMSMNIVTIVAAAAVAIIPILFFAIAPVLPSGD